MNPVNRHPAIQKSKILRTTRTFAVKREKTPSVESTPPLGLIEYRKKNAPKFQTKYGIELPASTRIIRVVLLIIWAIFKYINSLLGKTHMIQIFSKKHVQHTR
jgi:hypothetical protein